MTRFLRLLHALPALLFTALPAAANECDRLPPPSIRIERLDERITLDLHYDHRQLQSLAGALARPGHRILGLTRGNAVVRFDTQTISYVDRQGRWECASPQIVLSYGFKPLTVHVAREFPPNTCAYREIHAHEMRHVRAYQAHAAAIESEIADTLRQRFAGGGVWRGPAGQARSRLQQELDERWIPYVKRTLEKVEAQQALIDTPEEYARVADACGGEIRSRIR